MRAKILIILLGSVAFIPSAGVAQQQEPVVVARPPWPTTIVTKEQFEQLSPDAMIDVNGQRLTKRLFLQQNAAATDRVTKRITELQAEAQARFEARRKAFLDAEQAKLDESQKKTMAVAKVLFDQLKARRPANYDDLVKQGIALRQRAQANPPPNEADAADIEKQGRELLKALDPESAKASPN
jgi:hypothetical protein